MQRISSTVSSRVACCAARAPKLIYIAARPSPPGKASAYFGHQSGAAPPPQQKPAAASGKALAGASPPAHLAALGDGAAAASSDSEEDMPLHSRKRKIAQRERVGFQYE